MTFEEEYCSLMELLNSLENEEFIISIPVDNSEEEAENNDKEA